MSRISKVRNTSKSRSVRQSNKLDQKSVSIVVLNWNGKRFIDDFLKSVEQQSYDKDLLEIVFTDNASVDDSVAYFEKSMEGSKIKYKTVLNNKNYGYAGGNNRGIPEGAGEYILVCNNDLQLAPTLIEELVAIATKKSSAVTVPKLMYSNKKGIINNAGSWIDSDSDWPTYETGANEKDQGQYNDVREISAFCGACVLFTRDFLQTVGLFDDKFFMYFEDGDLSWRGQKAGYRYFYAPKAVAYHIHTGSSTEGSPLFNHFVGRNRLLILAKNGKFRPWLLAWVKTLRHHLLSRIKHLVQAVFGRYPKRLALHEFWLSQKMLWAAVLLTPYAICKRLHIIKEVKL